MGRHSKGRGGTSQPAKTAPALPPSGPDLPRYVPSPEHKTHPGSWGQAQWHPRTPSLSPCPTSITPETAQSWLTSALKLAGATSPPAYVYWYDSQHGRFFMAQRLQRSDVPWEKATYKGYPIEDNEVPVETTNVLLEKNIITQEVHLRAKRARRHRREGYDHRR